MPDQSCLGIEPSCRKMADKQIPGADNRFSQTVPHLVPGNHHAIWRKWEILG